MSITADAGKQGWVRRLMRPLAWALAGIFLFGRSACAVNASAPLAETKQPSFAFYYGTAPIPVTELSAFDNVVIEPDSGFDPKSAPSTHTDWLAYTSVGEVTAHRSYYSRIPKSWLLGGNHAWGSTVVDQAAAGWPQFFVEQVIAPLWQKGYRGFFLDTLDSFQLVAKTAAARQRQQDGLAAVIRAIKARYPDARLVFNRGFEILPQVHQLAYAVTFESLFRGWNQGTQRYTEVPQNDRDWLLAQAKTIREQYGLPVVSIDYCAPKNRACARDTVARIKALGLIPYVADPGLNTVGIGAVEVHPRRILMIQDPAPDVSLNVSDGVLYVATPLNYLGYQLDYLNANSQALPTQPISDRYAGIVVWLNNPVHHPAQFREWISAQVHAGVPLVFLNSFGMPVAGRFAETLGLEAVGGQPQGPLTVASSDHALIGYEMPPTPDPQDFTPVRVAAGSHSLLRLKAGEFEIDAAALTPWGGYVMRPFGVFTMDALEQARWVAQPFKFFQQALRLPEMPAPDPTTENGRRLFMSHIDGDGFASKIEFHPQDGDQYSGEALYRVLARYGLPVTASVVEGEIAAEGPSHAVSPQLQQIARRLFALPNIEVASHTYTHPLPWMKVTGQGTSTNNYDAAEGGSQVDNSGLAIKIPGYHFDLDREISGSIESINRTLTPPGKRVEVLLWSGDCQVPASALKAASQAGVMNMNGGDTLITKSNPSLTSVAPHGVMKDGYYQVFAPNQNEEMYTQLWQGPFYGFTRVLETFQMTETPRRLKPIDVYYHMFSGTKQASLQALNSVYQAIVAMPVNPVFVSEYAQKVLDEQQTSVAREGDYWQVRNSGALRTVRLARGLAPDLRDARGVAGYLSGPDGVYVHLSASEARFRTLPLVEAAQLGLPYLSSANGRIENFQRLRHGLSFDLISHVAPQFEIASRGACKVQADGRTLSATHSAGLARFSMGTVGVPVHQPEQRIHLDVECRA
jgi:hypothetical protein